tara:strand:- start:29 stop:286 length:258 start_codon:yes stop_codon:yes gene_type:complete
MSSEIHRYIETRINKKENLFNAEVNNFPNDTNIKTFIEKEKNQINFWKLYDKSDKNEDGDQLKAVLGICMMFLSLVIMGIYSNFL